MNPFIGEIKIVSFNFAPPGWLKCEGQLLNIVNNTALFSLVGTTYGGDGEVTFGIPDLRGRVIVSPGQGAGLSNYQWGQKTGVENVAITTAQMPQHNHLVKLGGTAITPAGANSFIGSVTGGDTIFNSVESSSTLSTSALTNTGSSQAHENRMPLLAIYRIIAITGLYPSPT